MKLCVNRMMSRCDERGFACAMRPGCFHVSGLAWRLGGCVCEMQVRGRVSDGTDCATNSTSLDPHITVCRRSREVDVSILPYVLVQYLLEISA